VHIGEGMLICVPAAKTQVNAANEGNIVVNYNELLVMGLEPSAGTGSRTSTTYPEQSHIGKVLGYEMIRVP
jgi:hypothetical protein